jgi:tetratricopeptide (TPR) repeat protein
LEVSNRVRELSDLIREVPDLVRELPDLVHEVSDLIRKRSDLIRELSDLIHEVSDLVHEVPDLVRELSDLDREIHIPFSEDHTRAKDSYAHLSMTFDELFAEFRDPERLAARIAFHKRIVDEEEAARNACERVLTGPSRWWDNAIRQQQSGRTGGMVTVLIERSETALAHSPLDSLALAEIAVGIAKEIDVSEYPYDYVYKIRGLALLRHAYVLSYVGKLREAADVADLSEHYLRQMTVVSTEIARLDLVRSNIARNMEKYEEAIELARRSVEDFVWFGERERAAQALEYEAAARYSSHDYRGARDVWLSMDEYAEELSAEQRAVRLHNLGLCAGALGDFADAARYYGLAADAFERLGLAVNRVKCRHSIARALHAAGRPADAIPVAEKAWRELEDLGMDGDAAIAALLLAECLLAVGRTEEVPRIARMLIDRCTRAGMSSSAMTALAFLREALVFGHATPDLVRHVREFMDDINAGRERPFRGEA